MKHKNVTIKRPQECMFTEALGTGDDVHVEERLTIVFRYPHIQALVKVLQVISQSSKWLEIYSFEIEMT